MSNWSAHMSTIRRLLAVTEAYRVMWRTLVRACLPQYLREAIGSAAACELAKLYSISVRSAFHYIFEAFGDILPVKPPMPFKELPRALSAIAKLVDAVAVLPDELTPVSIEANAATIVIRMRGGCPDEWQRAATTGEVAGVTSALLQGDVCPKPASECRVPSACRLVCEAEEVDGSCVVTLHRT